MDKYEVHHNDAKIVSETIETIEADRLLFNHECFIFAKYDEDGISENFAWYPIKSFHVTKIL